MEFVKFKNQKPINREFTFTCGLEGTFDELRISCSSNYSLFLDGKVVGFGPSRSPAGLSRVRIHKVAGSLKSLSVKVLYYGFGTFDLDEGDFYFGIEAKKEGTVVASTQAFVAKIDPEHIEESSKYSFQRGLIERYDLAKKEAADVDLEKTNIQIIGELADNCDYLPLKPAFIEKGPFKGFAEIRPVHTAHPELIKAYVKFDVQEVFEKYIASDCLYERYQFDGVRSGLIRLDIEAISDDTVYIVFDEYLPEGKWIYGRSSCHDLVQVKLVKGKHTLFTNVPYTLKHLMVIHKNAEDKVLPSLVLIQNDSIVIPTYGDKDIDRVINAASRTFAQNAVDLFTDCPGRERAGWLCDAYFTGMAEGFFTGKYEIEKAFLENFIYGSWNDVPEKIVPMCYPSRHADHNFIPNWAMWFILEIKRYYDDTKDKELVMKVKDRVYGIMSFLKDYENEYSLLENLPAWVFVEWSDANSREFIQGVNFPSNMTYAACFKVIGELYGDKDATLKAAALKDIINQMSFDGYYCDNAIRVDGKLVPCRDHVSETCQYYALFLGINRSKKLADRMVSNFALTQQVNPDGVRKSNVFIGNFLRMLWLLRIGEKKRILDECLPYFGEMAKESGTLWEKSVPNASCNHGFASSIAPIIDACLK